MATPSQRAISILVYSVATSAVGDKPTGTAEGDGLRADLYLESDTAPNVPSGWTQRDVQECNTSGNEFRHYCYTKRAGASEPSTYTWDGWASAGRSLRIIALQSVKEGTSDDWWSFVAGAAKDNLTGSTYPDVSGTTTDNEELLSWVGGNFGNPSAHVQPNAFNEREDAAGATLYVCDKVQEVAGATGTITGASYTGTAQTTTAIMLGVRPSSAVTFPSRAGTPALTQLTSANPGSVTMPSGIVAGELLLVFCAGDTSGSMSQSGGSDWDRLDNGANGAVVQGAIFAKVAAGGDTLSVQFEANDFAAVAVRVKDHGVTDPAADIVVGTAATGATAAPDPPNCDPGTVDDYLWMEHAASDDDDNAVNYHTPGWTQVNQAESAQSTSSCMSSVAYIKQNASSLNPAAMVLAASEEWRAQTIAIPPAAAATAFPFSRGRRAGTSRIDPCLLARF